MSTYILQKDLPEAKAGMEYITDGYYEKDNSKVVFPIFKDNENPLYKESVYSEEYMKTHCEWFKLKKEKMESENLSIPLATLNGHSGITWNALDKKVDEIMVSLNGYSYSDLELVTKSILLKGRRHPIEVKNIK